MYLFYRFNDIVYNYIWKHFASLFPLGIDGNVTQGSVPWTQRGGGEHLNTPKYHFTYAESLDILGLSVADQS